MVTLIVLKCLLPWASGFSLLPFLILSLSLSCKPSLRLVAPHHHLIYHAMNSVLNFVCPASKSRVRFPSLIVIDCAFRCCPLNYNFVNRPLRRG